MRFIPYGSFGVKADSFSLFIPVSWIEIFSLFKCLNTSARYLQYIQEAFSAKLRWTSSKLSQGSLPVLQELWSRISSMGLQNQRQGRVRKGRRLPSPPPCHDCDKYVGEGFPALRPYESVEFLLTIMVILVGWLMSNPLWSDLVLQKSLILPCRVGVINSDYNPPLQGMVWQW